MMYNNIIDEIICKPNFCQFNIRGLRENYEKLDNFLKMYRPEVVCLQETKLNPNATIGRNRPIEFKNYKIYRKDSIGNKWGVAILVHTDIPQSLLNINSSLEQVSVKIKFRNKDISVTSLYLPNRIPIEKEQLEDLNKQLLNHKIILTDSNSHHTLWGSPRDDARGRTIVEFTTENNLIILNGDEPTFISANGVPSHIDLSIVSPHLVLDSEWHTHSDMMGSDHIPTYITYPKENRKTRTIQRYNIKLANWNAYKRSAKIEINGNNIEEKCELLTNSIIKAADENIPINKTTISNRIKVPWWTEECRNALTNRNRALRDYQKNKTQEKYIEYKKVRAIAKRTIKEAKRKTWREYITKISINTPAKEVWNTIRVISGRRGRLGIRYLKKDGEVITDIKTIANMIGEKISENSDNKNCSANFLDRKKKLEENSPNFNTTSEKLDNSYNNPFTIIELEKILDKIKGTSAGPDQVRYEMIQNLDPENKLKLLEYYNEIWKSKKFPKKWLFATIIPILKLGKDPNEADSFRPIALTNCLCKIMERLVNNRLLYVLEKYNIICPYQSGFRKNRCTYDNLTRLEHDIQRAFEYKSSVLAVFLDIKKAYDMSWRRGIIQKLFDIGLRGELPIFVANLLSERTFRVKVGNEYSDIFNQENGVPQGSVISPTLFMILINDLLKDISPHIRFALYADDIVIWCDLDNIEESKKEIQKTLDKVGAWQDLWGTSFSSTKSNYIIFTNKRKIPKIEIKINGANIPATKSSFFLGMKFDSKLTWREHIEYLVKACSKRIDVMRCVQGTSWGADRHSLILIYKMFIRSKLDYGSHLYDSAAETHKKKLNTIQNNALRIATGLLRCTKIEALEVEANVYPLQMHRDKMSFNYGLKILANNKNPTHQYLKDYEQEDKKKKTFSERLQDIGEKYEININNVDNSCNFPLPPWEEAKFNIDLSIHTGPKIYQPIEKLKQESMKTISKYSNAIKIYTDGSVNEEKVGIGIYNEGFQTSTRLPDNLSIFTAEAYAILEALTQGLKQKKKDIVILTDSLSCLRAIENMSGKHPIITRITNMLYYSSKKIVLCWIPSHTGISGNDHADRRAKRAIDQRITKDMKIPIQDLKRTITKNINKEWQRKWNNIHRYPKAKIKEKIGEWKSSNRRNRKEEIVLARSRVDTIKVADLIPRIEGRGIERCNYDNQRLHLYHIIFVCQRFSNERKKIIDMLDRDNKLHSLKNILYDDPRYCDAVLEYLWNINYINKI